MPVGCSRFSRRCNLIIDLYFPWLGKFGPRLSRSHLNSAVKLGCSGTNFLPILYATALVVFWLLRKGSVLRDRRFLELRAEAVHFEMLADSKRRQAALLEGKHQ